LKFELKIKLAHQLVQPRETFKPILLFFLGCFLFSSWQSAREGQTDRRTDEQMRNEIYKTDV